MRPATHSGPESQTLHLSIQTRALASRAALVILAYILGQLVVPVDRWPDPVLKAESIWPAYHGAKWVVERIPVEYRPLVPYAPPPGHETTSAALLQATPQGKAVGR